MMAAFLGDLSPNGNGNLPVAEEQGGSSSPVAPAMDDPFFSPQVETASHREPHRYSVFDSQLFTLNAFSPAQAKRALEAHLAETERRLEEASRLGTALIQQQQELAEKLKEVERQQNEGEIGEELRRKLVDLEKEYNEIGRETARAFLAPKRLVGASDENNVGTPSVEHKSPISPALFAGQATNSPSKVTVPSRKQRNQPSNRVHDIEFATEISTSLLAQVRQLQTLLAEREEALKNANLEKSRLELEAEGYAQRIRVLDESEQRYKDENWSLETQTHELMAAVKEAAERENKLNSNLSSITAEKNSVERELEDLKQFNSKLIEDQIAAQKANDAEIHLLRRNLNAGDTEKLVLQQKLDEVTSQYQELAKAVALTIKQQREAEAAREVSLDDEIDGQDESTPENSPPSSPTRPTPRHNHLETETLRSSLGHAHRMIQNLKSTIHREKTEKIELKRMLQESRDELEQRRRDSVVGTTTSNKRQKTKSDAYRKPPRPELLGAGRKGKTEVEVHETDWEDSSPSHSSTSKLSKSHRGAESPGEPGDAYHSATEDAFETANEREVTESEAFQTSIESMADDSSDTEKLTETETTPQRTPRRRVPSSLFVAKARDRHSLQSTASTSADEDEDDKEEFVSPTQVPRYRLRVKRGVPLRRVRPSGEAPMASHSRPSSARESPATSFSHGSTAPEGQSLFAELAELGSPGSEEGDFGPPIRDHAASQASTPRIHPASESRRPSEVILNTPQKPIMVDSGMMTEPPAPPGSSQSASDTAGWFLGRRNGFWLRDPLLGNSAPQWSPLRSTSGSNTDEWSTRSVPSQTMLDDITPSPKDEEISFIFPEPPQVELSPVFSQETVPLALTIPERGVSYVLGGTTEPVEKDVSAPQVPERGLSSIFSQHTEPVMARLQETEHVIPELDFSPIYSSRTKPEPAVPVELAISLINSQQSEPQHAVPMDLKLSSVHSEYTEPECAVPLALALSSINTEQTEPKSAVPVELTVSSTRSESTEPVYAVPLELEVSLVNSEHTEPECAVPMELEVSSISSAHTAPVIPSLPEPEPVELTVSSISSEHTQPEPVIHRAPQIERAIPVELTVSSVSSEHTEPKPVIPRSLESERAVPVELAVSSITSEHTEPVMAKVSEPRHAELTVSSVCAEQHTEPVVPEIPEPKLPEIIISAISSENTEPIVPRLPIAELSVSSVCSEHTQPVMAKIPEPERPEMAVSSVSCEHTEPVMPNHAELAVSSVCSEHTEPVKARVPEPEHVELTVSSICSEITEPTIPRLPEPERAEMAFSSIYSQQTQPVMARVPEPRRPELEMSSVFSQHTEPVSATLPEPVIEQVAVKPEIPELAISLVNSEWTEPIAPQTPHIPVPLVPELLVSDVRTVETLPVESVSRTIPAALASDRNEDVFVSTSSQTEHPGSALSSVSGNAFPRLSRQQSSGSTKADQGAQTILSSTQIDQILMDRVSTRSLSPPDSDHMKSSLLATPKARPHLERLSSTPSNKSDPRRPSSSASQASFATGQQALPDEDEKRTVEQQPPASSSSLMGPPLAPASALKTSTLQRPRTPNDHASQAGSGSARQSSRIRPRHSSQLSQRSSVSSFASELDERFNANPAPTPYGYGAGTDPRMIQAITQTMIGEFLWKYTRKAVSGDMSSTRHRRYFWVHPYTRTLYWSVQDPQAAGKAELKTKSVHIEAVRVVADENPYPPGLHCKSLEVVSPGRRVRFTATTSQRHETWFNALSYLLLRNSNENVEEHEGNFPLEDIDEFNTGFLSNSQHPGRTSVSSYNSRSLRSAPKQRASSVMSTRPAANPGRASPALSGPSQSPSLHVPDRQSSSSRLSSLFNSSIRGSLSHRKVRRGQLDGSLYEESIDDHHASTDDLRQAADRQDQDTDRLENVRACCDGKHDVSSLSRTSRYSPNVNRHQHH